MRPPLPRAARRPAGRRRMPDLECQFRFLLPPIATRAPVVPASPPCSVRPTPEERISPSSGCWRTHSKSSGCRCGYWRAKSITAPSSGSAPRRSRSSPARRRSSRPIRAFGWRPSRRCRAISTSHSSPSTKSSWPPISRRITSLPTACCTDAGARRRWCSAPPPCGRSSSGCCPAPASSAGRDCRSSPSRAKKNSPGCRAGPPS